MAYFQPRDIPKLPERSNQDYLDPSRSELVNHYRTEAKKEPNHTIGDFLTKTFWSFIYHYIKSRFGRKYPYPSYQPPETGIHDLAFEQEISIAVTSDWATDTAESFAIAEQIRNHNPDFTIHVGDTYYVGAPFEILSNFVEAGSPWVRGNSGSFAVLGNHEMYARGDAFFEHLLPALGIRNPAGAYTGQKAGYFCLQTPYWRILGLDTGYHSTGKPVLEFIPGLEPDCHFDDTQMDWLKNTVNLGDPSDKRGILIFTHHQFITAFGKEPEFSKPAQQLASLLGPERTVLWLWGHEHKLAFYQKMRIDTGTSVYGRCIGNGGTPIEINAKNFTLDKDKSGYKALVAFDKRFQKAVNDNPLGFNGYSVLKLERETLTLSYYDNVAHLLTEQWTVDRQAGTIRGEIKVPADGKLELTGGKSWADAVR